MVDVRQKTRPTPQSASDEAFIKAVEKGLDIIVLVSGILTDGSSHYAYVSIPSSKYRAFKAAQAKGATNVRDYGDVIADGAGLEPDAATIERMQRQFGISHTFEDELLALMDDAMSDALAQEDAAQH